MATGALLGVFRSWFISSGVLELAEGEFFHWKAPWRQDRHFADEEGNRQVTFKRCKDALGPYCCVDLVNLTPRSGHRLLLCCLGLHLLLDPPGQRWAVQGFGG
jgi:hypothetical protein